MKDLLKRLLGRATEVGVEVRRDLLVQSAHASAFTSLMGLGLMLALVLALRGHGVGAGLNIWVGLMLVNTTAFQLACQWYTTHEPVPATRVRVQQWRLAVVFAISGIDWGSLTLLALPTGSHASGQALVCTALVMALAANIAFASATPVLFLAFHIPVTVTAAIGLQLGGATTLAGLMLFTLVGGLPLQKGLFLQISGAKLLARRNHLLAEELRAERAAVEQTNLSLVEANVELSHRATRDPLTGLANRALFFEHLASTLARSRPLGRPVSVIYFDLDRFKLINDTLGHAAGDELLRQIGPRIGETLRKSDVLARLGGDEFVVLTVDERGPSTAEALAERIRIGFEAPFRVGGRALHVTPSLGVAHDHGLGTGETLVADADAALYRAKELGRNRVQTFDGSLRSSLRARVRDEHAVGRLFGAEASVTARFQQGLNAHTGAGVGVEVSIGLDEPGTEPLAGDALRDLAVRTGVSAQLDEELLRQAGLFLTGLGPHRDPGYQVLARLGRPDVEFDDLARFLQTPAMSGVRTGLSIAVAERQIVSDLDTASLRLQAIRDLEVRVVLDDVGSGISSLALLVCLPLDGLRLHPELVQAAATDDGPAIAMLAGVVEVARQRGLLIAARGVDTEAQLALLRRFGVEQIQGDLVPAARAAV